MIISPELCEIGSNYAKKSQKRAPRLKIKILKSGTGFRSPRGPTFQISWSYDLKPRRSESPNKQTNKHTDRQTNRQTNRQTYRQTNTTNKQTHKNTNTPTHKHTNTQTNKQNKQTKQTNTKLNRQAVRPTRHANSQTRPDQIRREQAGRQTGS